MKKVVHALAFIVVMLIATAPSPPLISVTGTVYNDNGLPAPGTRVTFSSLSTQVVGGVEVPPSSFTATADATGAISVSLPRSLRVNVVIGKGAPMAVTLPDQASIDLSALLAAVQVPPPATLVSSLSVAPGGDYALAVTNPSAMGAATLSPGNVTRLNGNPVAAFVPNPGEFLIEDSGGVAWEPFSLSGDVSASPLVPGQLAVNHFTLGSSASAAGFKLQNLAAGAAAGDAIAFGVNHLNDLAAATGNYTMNSNRLTGLAAPAATGDALSEGAPIGAITPAAGSFTGLTGSGTNGPTLSNLNLNGAFNVKAYGAKGDANNDDAASIQAAINAACAVTTNNASGSTVYFPTGTYRHSKPLQLPCSNLTLTGAGWNSSTLYPAFGYGPAIMIVGSGYTGLETGTSLATGAGSAMLFDGLRYWLNLRDSPTLDLNGLSAFTVEAFVKPTATNDGQIITSSGRFLASSPATQAFSLQMVSSQLEGRLNVGGTTYIVDSGPGNTLSPNIVYHAAMSWDGSTIRIFINGTLVASRSASGTIQQAITEDVTIGPSIYDWPDGSILGNAIHGYVDSIRLSKTGRYTASFTAPTAKLTADSNTLGLLNFDQIQGPMVGMNTSNGLAWIPVRRTNEPNGTSEISNSAAVLNNVVLSDFGINASYGQNGIFATVTLNSVFDRLWISGTRNGFYLWNNCYQNSSHNVAINTSGTSTLGRIGLANIGQSGVNQFHHLRVNGGPYPLVDHEGSMLLDMLDVAQQSNTVYGAFFKASGDSTVTLNSPIIDAEAGGTTWLGAMVFSSIGSAVANGGEIDSTNSAPAVIVDGGGSLSLLGNRMSLSGTPPAAIHVINAPSQKIAVVEPVTVGLGSAPLSDLPSSTVTLNKETLDGVSVNGVRNVRAYGATASMTTATAATTANNTTITLSAAGDFANGQNVMIPHAGATPLISTPAGFTLAAHSTNTSAFDTSACNAVGSVTCTTSWTYQIVGADSMGGLTAPAAAVTITNGPSALSVFDYNQLSWNVADANTVGWLIYSCSGASCTPVLTAVMPLIYGRDGTGLPTTMTWNDMGKPYGADADLGTTLPASATRQNLYTTISSGGGTATLALAAAPGVTSSFTLRHDDSVPINAALTAACNTNGGDVFIPPGIYSIGQTINMYKCIGVRLIGTGGQGPVSNSRLVWRGPTGGTAVSVNQYHDDAIERVQITQYQGNTPGIALALDRYDAGGGITISSTHFSLEHVDIDQAGVGVMISNQSGSNVAENAFVDVMLATGNASYGGWAGYYLNSGQVKNTRMINGEVGSKVYGFYLAGGSYHSFGQNISTNSINFGGTFASIGEPINIIGCESEGENRFLNMESSGAGTTSMINIIGCLSITAGAGYLPYDGNINNSIYIRWTARGPINLIGNQFGNINVPSWRAYFDAGDGVAAVKSSGNVYPNANPFSGTSPVRYHIIEAADQLIDSSTIFVISRVLGPAPTVSACGSTPNGSVNTGSTNYQGSIVVGGGTVTACTLTFATYTPFTAAPNCQLYDQTTRQSLNISAASSSAITFNAATDMHGDIVNYSCPGI